MLAALASSPATKALDPDPFPRHSLRHAVYAALLHFGFETADTFNFTRYGVLHGKVLNVSLDAITRDKPQDRNSEKALGAETTSSEPRGQELIYLARISLDRTRMQVDSKKVNLVPGMAVTVEIKTGQRTIISYLLSPLMRYRQESLRER